MTKSLFGCARLVTCRQGHSFAAATGSPRTLCKPNSATEAAGDPLVGRDLAGEVEDLPMQTMKIHEIAKKTLNFGTVCAYVNWLTPCHNVFFFQSEAHDMPRVFESLS